MAMFRDHVKAGLEQAKADFGGEHRSAECCDAERSQLGSYCMTVVLIRGETVRG